MTSFCTFFQIRVKETTSPLSKEFKRGFYHSQVVNSKYNHLDMAKSLFDDRMLHNDNFFENLSLSMSNGIMKFNPQHNLIVYVHLAVNIKGPPPPRRNY